MSVAFAKDPSSSSKQHRFMEAIARNGKFAREAGVPQSVGKKFTRADEGKSEDMSPSDFTQLESLMDKWLQEERSEPEHADDDAPKQAAGIVYQLPDGRVLLLKRAGKEGVDNYVGHWALPGGSAEPNESPQQAALRESKEEIGWAPQDDSDFSVLRKTNTPNGIQFTTFRCPVAEEFEPKLNAEHSEAGWHHPDDLPEPMHPAVLRAIKGDGANDCLAMDRDSVRKLDEDGHLRVERTPISKAVINPYYGHEIPEAETLGLDPQKIYYLLRDPKELEKAAKTFSGKPVMDTHNPQAADDHPRKDVVGSLGDDIKYEHPYLTAPLHIWDGKAIDGIDKKRKRELSASYRYDADMTPGVYEGKPYDGVMRNIRGNHVALVESGRAGNDVYVKDSALSAMDAKVVAHGKALTSSEGKFSSDTKHKSKDSRRASDSKEKGMKKHVELSQTAAFLMGGVSTYLLPKLAKDANIDLRPIFNGVTKKNLATQKPKLITGIKSVTKGKLAKDASLDNLAAFIDKFGEQAEDAESEEAVNENETLKGENEDELDDTSMDTDDPVREKLTEYGLSEDQINEICSMIKPEEAQDDEMDDPDAEPKDMGEDEEADGPEKMPKEMDKKAKDRKAKDKKAMDENSIIKRAQDAMMKNLNDIRKAERAVFPLIGTVNMAQDSADKIYLAALKHCKVDVKDVHPSAYPALVDMQIKLQKQSKQPHLIGGTDYAADADTVSSGMKSLGIESRSIKRL